MLLYGTGGFAYGGVKNEAIYTQGAFRYDASKNGTQTGYAAGAGLEYKINPAWSLKGEYQYVDLGSVTVSGVSNNGLSFSSSSIDTNFHTVRVGVNYQFGRGYDPLK